MTRGATAVTALGLLLAACSGSSSDPPTSVDRLVVIDQGEVVTMDRSGGDRVTVGGEVTGEPFQPIWSPDGSRIAYSYTAAPDDFGVAVADVAEGDTETVRVAAHVFYLYWSPAGDRVGTLRNDLGGGVAFEVAAVDEAGLTVDGVDSGGSYFFSWSPDGEQIAVHVGTDRLEVLTGDEFEVLDDAPSIFQAPQWLDDGIVAIRVGAGAPVVTRFADGELDELVEVAGPASFHVSPDGKQLAVQGAAAARNDVVEAALRATPEDAPLPANRVHVIDLASGEVDEVVNRLVAGFWWSPDGERLLLVEAADTERPELVWRVWEDGELTDGPRFRPDPRWLRDLFPFIDQYNRSMTPWAPDSTAYAFPGAVDGEAGIWVAEVDEAEPVRISGGSWVAWSPT